MFQEVEEEVQLEVKNRLGSDLAQQGPRLLAEDELLGEGEQVLAQERMDAVLSGDNILSQQLIGGEQGSQVLDQVGGDHNGVDLLFTRENLSLDDPGELFGVDLVGLFIGKTDDLELVGVGDDDLGDPVLEALDEGKGVDGGLDQDVSIGGEGRAEEFEASGVQIEGYQPFRAGLLQVTAGEAVGVQIDSEENHGTSLWETGIGSCVYTGYSAGGRILKELMRWPVAIR